MTCHRIGGIDNLTGRDLPPFRKRPVGRTLKLSVPPGMPWTEELP